RIPRRSPQGTTPPVALGHEGEDREDSFPREYASPASRVRDYARRAMSLVARFAPRGLPRAYWWLWTATLVNRLGNFVVPFLALYLTEARHIGVERVGWIVGCWGLGSILSGPIGGALADRIGRRRTILVGLVGG